MRGLLIAVAALAAFSSTAFASLSANATIAQTAVTGPAGSQTYSYKVTLTNTGDQDIGTFWYAWTPSGDFLPHLPTVQTMPSGWYGYTSGFGPPYGGYSIEWYNYFGDAIGPGQTQTFEFSSPDSPNVLKSSSSPVYPGFPVQTSFIYGGTPLSDAGFSFVLPAPSVPAVPEPGTLGMLVAGGVMLLRRKRVCGAK